MTSTSHLPSSRLFSLVLLISGALFTLNLCFLSPVDPPPTPLTTSSSLSIDQYSSSLSPDQSPPDLALVESSPQKTYVNATQGLGSRVKTSTHKAQRRAEVLPEDFNLGEHTVMLQGGEFRLRIALSLHTSSPLLMRRMIPLKRQLISMLYFLLSHRVPESLRTPSGEERLRRDLLQRYAHVLRGDEFELYFDTLTLEELSFETEEER